MHVKTKGKFRVKQGVSVAIHNEVAPTNHSNVVCERVALIGPLNSLRVT